MKNLFTFLLIAFFTTTFFAQQQQHNTQFMHYKLGYNPAYAGSQDVPCVTCIYRNQWIGLDGAPKTQIVSFNMPLAHQRVGVGANLVRHTIGITETYTLDAIYSYRFRLGEGMLGLGVSGSIRSMENDFQLTTATQPKGDDASIPTGTQDKFLFNFGAGAYYSSQKFYIGISAPRLLKNNIDFADLDDAFVSREVQHFYLMGGLIFELNDNLKLQPQTLIKFAPRVPLDVDANVNLLIMDKYTFGITYRLGGNTNSGIGESLDILLAAQVSSNLLFGLSYDITISDLREYNSGSIEAMLHYCFGKSEGDEYLNPRFF